ncbi:MAG TPA: tRNA (adenosine(37)-N6)-threonylcarbamoyltransferase complex ATPase subunit type 1 TsaE [Gemmatimonadaceae bacterium]|jgi:tRNA threonylcarbamoyladenosine biosynthesis protein TsaE|nr:tRNA (adenosine(37)-N6)-threonylcarbamoyltransferase complex ATPase subunit type 1 TsaE [Gemmatimonadaceae bacterium]
MSHAPIIPPLAAHGRLACTEAELVAWGEALGRAVTPPLVVTISGELGAGKTTLVKAICRGYGVSEEVTSPTFALVHQYAGERSTVYHVDLYRVNDPRELTNLGWDEMMAEDALVLIEWPERAGDRLPRVHVPISLQHLPNEPGRRLLYAGGHV